MAQTELIPEAVKSTILLKLRSYEASTLASVGFFSPSHFKNNRLHSLEFEHSINATGAKINSSQIPAVYFSSAVLDHSPHLIVVYFPWKTQEVRNAGCPVWCFCKAFRAPMALSPSRFTSGESAASELLFCFFVFFKLFQLELENCRRFRVKLYFIKSLLIWGECQAKRLFILFSFLLL